MPETAEPTLERALEISRPFSRRDRWVLRIALAVVWLLRGLSNSLRIAPTQGEEHLRTWVSERVPTILVGWHQGVLVCGHFFSHLLAREELTLSVLASQSRDGELLAQVAQRSGVRPIRGSASRGGLHGMRSLNRALREESSSVALAPDGPRGPARACKPGAIVLAQTSGAPILPMACAARPAWRLRSWDSMLMPYPFSKIAVSFGKRIRVPSELSAVELNRYTLELQETLERLVRDAESVL